MMISSKGRYALRVMLDMAEQGGDSYLPLKDLLESGEKNHDKCGGCMACGRKEVEGK